MEAIETEYGGFRFRSRLEARWAVFFDEYDVDFLYEPEGFVFRWDATPWWSQRPTFQYLPDFYLPDLNMYCEVKGSWNEYDRHKTINGAYALSNEGMDVLILGDVFRQPRGGSRRPWRLHTYDSAVWGFPWPLPTDPANIRVCDPTDPEIFYNCPDLLRGYVDETPMLDAAYLAAARTAQRARFEWDEVPEVRRKR